MDNSNFFNNLELNNILNYNEIINNDLSPPKLININNNNNLDEDVEEVPDNE